MPDAIAQLLNEGKVQLFCADAMDGEGLLNGDLPQRRRAELQEKYFVYLTAELAPRILTLNNAKKHPDLDCRCRLALTTPSTAVCAVPPCLQVLWAWAASTT